MVELGLGSKSQRQKKVSWSLGVEGNGNGWEKGGKGEGGQGGERHKAASRRDSTWGPRPEGFSG